MSILPNFDGTNAFFSHIQQAPGPHFRMEGKSLMKNNCENAFYFQSVFLLNKANTFDTKAAFLDLHLSISNDIVSTKIYDKRDDFDFEIVNFPIIDGDFRRSTSYSLYLSTHLFC